MPIENRNLIKGTKLTGRYHKQSYSCEVVENAEGKIRYRLQDGREFKSPSAAGMAVTGHASDGWIFWSLVKTEDAPKPDAENQAPTLQTTETIATVDAKQTTAPQPTAKDVTSAEKATSKKTGVFLVPNQKGVPEGQIRWFCRDCGKSFIASAVEVPGVCPNHQTS